MTDPAYGHDEEYRCPECCALQLEPGPCYLCGWGLDDDA